MAPASSVSAVMPTSTSSTLDASVERTSIRHSPTRCLCLEVMRSFAQHSGFTSEVSLYSIKSVWRWTKIVYKWKWNIYHQWCIQNNLKLLHPKVSIIFHFLTWAFEKGFASSTVALYKASLSIIFRYSKCQKVLEFPALSCLLKLFCTIRPKQGHWLILLLIPCFILLLNFFAIYFCWCWLVYIASQSCLQSICIGLFIHDYEKPIWSKNKDDLRRLKCSSVHSDSLLFNLCYVLLQ